MSGQVLTLILIAILFAAVAAVRFFRTLDAIFWRDAATPVIAGLIAGGLLFFLDSGQQTADSGLTLLSAARCLLSAVVLTLAALYVRLTGRESEPGDGMLLGALTGASAALFNLDRFSECVIAGAITGYGVTYAAFYVRQRGKQIAIDSFTAIAAIGGALLPRVVIVPDFDVVVTIAIPLIAIIALLKQWRDVTRELMDEANLGFLDAGDVRIVSHPIRRLGAAGWADRNARREFVRIANMIALRKRQQRNRPEEEVRLYQVEIIKLRMQLQEMTRIDQEVRAHLG
ncbi:MAG TPA: hypothetical protein VJ901_09535 [Thermoanaerobaculia bacterium]|nr:hypothetical protein [Thermoanaerobaculia bacterium]